MCGLCVRRAVQYVSYILIFYANSPLMISHILYSYQPTRWYGILYPGWPHTKNIWCHNLCQAPCSIPYLVPTLTSSLTSSHFLPCPLSNLVPYLVPSLSSSYPFYLFPSLTSSILHFLPHKGTETDTEMHYYILFSKVQEFFNNLSSFNLF